MNIGQYSIPSFSFQYVHNKTPGGLVFVGIRRQVAPNPETGRKKPKRGRRSTKGSAQKGVKETSQTLTIVFKQGFPHFFINGSMSDSELVLKVNPFLLIVMWFEREVAITNEPVTKLSLFTGLGGISWVRALRESKFDWKGYPTAHEDLQRKVSLSSQLVLGVIVILSQLINCKWCPGSLQPPLRWSKSPSVRRKPRWPREGFSMEIEWQNWIADSKWRPSEAHSVIQRVSQWCLQKSQEPKSSLTPPPWDSPEWKSKERLKTLTTTSLPATSKVSLRISCLTLTSRELSPIGPTWEMGNKTRNQSWDRQNRQPASRTKQNFHISHLAKWEPY